MKINFHETDPMEADAVVHPKNDKGLAMEIEPYFYGKAKNSMVCVVTTQTNSGKPLYRYRLKATDSGKLFLEDLGEARILEVDM